MKFLFIVKPVHHWERIGILTLSSILKQHNHTVELYDINKKTPERIAQDVQDSAPEIVAYSAMTTEIAGFLHVNRMLKQEVSVPFKSVFGGPHATFFPEMIDESGVDALCRGEAEHAILEYVDYLNGKRPPEQVPNFWIKDNSHLLRNAMAPWPGDLDGLPFPDRHLWDDFDRYPTQKAFFSSRGCPYECTYCFNHRYNMLYDNATPIVRRRSVNNFISEIKQVLTDYPKVAPFFDDDVFLATTKSWLEEFTKTYAKEVGKPFGCNIRPDQATEEKIQLLAESGCYMCWFGLETGDEDFSKRVMKRNLKNERIVETANILRKYGIRFATQNINALPAEDPLKTDFKTLELNIQCRPDFAQAHIFFPFPRTELCRYSQEKGLFNSDFLKLHDPLCRFTPLSFKENLKKELENQNKLFAITVAFPFLKRFLPFLRKLPLSGVYAILNHLYSGYCSRIKLTPVKKDLKHLFFLVLLFGRKVASK